MDLVIDAAGKMLKRAVLEIKYKFLKFGMIFAITMLNKVRIIII